MSYIMYDMEKYSMGKYKIKTESGNVQYVETENMQSLFGRFTDHRQTRGLRLYKTKKSNRFFLEEWSMWEGEASTISELSQKEAQECVSDNADIDEIIGLAKCLGMSAISEID